MQMAAFHVRDAVGNKLTDPAQIRYIEESLYYAERRGGDSCRAPGEVKTCLNNLVGASAGNLGSGDAVIELTASADHRGLLSELSATLLSLHFDVLSALSWTHNARSAFIFNVTGPATLPELELQLKRVVHSQSQLRVAASDPDRVSGERRLHQMMREDGDWDRMAKSTAVVTAVEMEVRRKKYMVEVRVRSGDRAKLMFDVACTLEDLEYEVVQASVGTEEGVSIQEYYVRKRDGMARVTEMEMGRIEKSLLAAVERRNWGMMGVEVRVVEYRSNLLWEITRVFRENGMLVVGVKWEKRGELAAGVFYLTGGSDSGDVAGGLLRDLRGQIGGYCVFGLLEF